MKQTIQLTLVGCLAAFAISSCAQQDPEYAAWKKKKAAESAATNNPYGAPAAGANPYGVPQTGGETGNYTQAAPAAGGNAPYQNIPGVGQPAAPIPTQPGAGAVGGTSHTVVSGDSLWGLARKYGTTIEAIQQANGLTTTNIQTGKTLTIPGR